MKKDYYLVGQRAFVVEDEKPDPALVARKAACLQQAYAGPPISHLSEHAIREEQLQRLLQAFHRFSQAFNQKIDELKLPTVLKLTDGTCPTNQLPINRFANELQILSFNIPTSLQTGYGTSGSERTRFHITVKQQLEDIYFYLNEQYQRGMPKPGVVLDAAAQKQALADIAGKLQSLVKVHGKCRDGVAGVFADLAAACNKKDNTSGLLKNLRKQILTRFKAECLEVILVPSGYAARLEVHLNHIDRDAYQAGFWDEAPATKRDDIFSDSKGYDEVRPTMQRVVDYSAKHLVPFLHRHYTPDAMVVALTDVTTRAVVNIINEFKGKDLYALPPGFPMLGAGATATLEKEFLIKMQPFIARKLFTEAELIITVSQAGEDVRMVNPRWHCAAEIFIRCMAESERTLIAGKWIGDCSAELAARLQKKAAISTQTVDYEADDASGVFYASRDQDTALISAVLMGKILQVQALLEVKTTDAKIDPNHANAKGMTALMAAVYNKKDQLHCQGRSRNPKEDQYLEPWEQKVMVKLLLQHPAIHLYDGLQGGRVQHFKVFHYALAPQVAIEVLELLLDRAVQDLQSHKIEAAQLTAIFTDSFIYSWQPEKLISILLRVPNLSLREIPDTAAPQGSVDDPEARVLYNRFLQTNRLVSFVCALRKKDNFKAVSLFSTLTLDAQTILKIMMQQCAPVVVEDFLKYLLANYQSPISPHFWLLAKKQFLTLNISAVLVFTRNKTEVYTTLMGLFMQDLLAFKDEATKKVAKRGLQELAELKVDPNTYIESRKVTVMMWTLRELSRVTRPKGFDVEVVSLLLEWPGIDVMPSDDTSPYNVLYYAAEYASDECFELIINHLVADADKRKLKKLAELLTHDYRNLPFDGEPPSILRYLMDKGRYTKLVYLLKTVPNLSLTGLRASQLTRQITLIRLVKEEKTDFSAAMPLFFQLVQDQPPPPVAVPSGIGSLLSGAVGVGKSWAYSLVSLVINSAGAFRVMESQQAEVQRDEAKQVEIKLVEVKQKDGAPAKNHFANYAQTLSLIAKQCGMASSNPFFQHLLLHGYKLLPSVWDVSYILALSDYITFDLDQPQRMAEVSGEPLTLLIRAIQLVNEPQVRELLSRKANPSLADGQGVTPLMHAAKISVPNAILNKITILKALLADPRTTLTTQWDEKGNSVLHHYLLSGAFNSQFFILLVERSIQEIGESKSLPQPSPALSQFFVRENNQGQSIVNLLVQRIIDHQAMPLLELLQSTLSFMVTNTVLVERIFLAVFARDENFYQFNDGIMVKVLNVFAPSFREQGAPAELFIRAVSTGRADQVRWLVENVASGSSAEDADSKVNASSPRFFQSAAAVSKAPRLLDINRDAGGKPIIFAVLERAKAGSKASPQHFQVLQCLIQAPTWQDYVHDEKGRTPLMRAVCCHGSVFEMILKSTSTATLLAGDDDAKTVMDLVIVRDVSQEEDKSHGKKHHDYLVPFLQAKLRGHMKAMKAAQPDKPGEKREAAPLIERLNEMRLLALELAKFYQMLINKDKMYTGPAITASAPNKKAMIEALIQALDDPQASTIKGLTSSFGTIIAAIPEIDQIYQFLQCWSISQPAKESSSTSLRMPALGYFNTDW